MTEPSQAEMEDLFSKEVFGIINDFNEIKQGDWVKYKIDSCEYIFLSKFIYETSSSTITLDIADMCAKNDSGYVYHGGYTKMTFIADSIRVFYHIQTPGETSVANSSHFCSLCTYTEVSTIGARCKWCT